MSMVDPRVRLGQRILAFVAAAIFVLNLLVLATIGYLYAAGSAVAIDSVRAMIFRTGIWLLLFLGLAWLGRGSDAPGI